MDLKWWANPGGVRNAGFKGTSAWLLPLTNMLPPACPDVENTLPQGWSESLWEEKNHSLQEKNRVKVRRTLEGPGIDHAIRPRAPFMRFIQGVVMHATTRKSTSKRQGQGRYKHEFQALAGPDQFICLFIYRTSIYGVPLTCQDLCQQRFLVLFCFTKLQLNPP